MIMRSESIAAATAKTIDLTTDNPAAAATKIQPAENVQHLTLSNATANPLYAVTDWTAGDTEVSATHLHFLVPANSAVTFTFARPIHNLRVISAGAGAAGIVAW